MLRLRAGTILIGFTTSLVTATAACDRQQTTVESKRVGMDAVGRTNAESLNAEEQAWLAEIAKSMGLSEQERVILRDFFERNHPAIRPLKDLIGKMDAELAPYLKEKWVLFSEHNKSLQASVSAYKVVLEKLLSSESARTALDALKKDLDVKVSKLELEVETAKKNIASLTADKEKSEGDLGARIRDLSKKLDDLKETSTNLAVNNSALEMLNTQLRNDRDEKAALVTSLRSELAQQQTSYDTALQNLRDAQVQIRELLGLIDSEGHPLEQVKITDIDSDTPATEALTLQGQATSFRAIARYTGSDVPRDVTHVSRWVVAGPEGSGQDAVTQRTLSPYVLLAASPLEGLKLQVSLGGMSHEVPLTVVPASRTEYSLTVKNLVSGESSTSLPRGVLGQLQLIATNKNHKNNVVSEFDVTNGADLSLTSGDGVILSQISPDVLRPGLFAGFRANSTLKVAATLKGARVLENVSVRITEPVAAAYFYPGWPVPFSSSSAANKLLCRMADGSPVFAADIVYANAYGSPQNPGTLTFTGTAIQPRLLAVKSDCTFPDESAKARFVVEGSPDAILKTAAKNFIAHRTTPEKSKVFAFWDNEAGTAITTLNSFTVTFKDRAMTEIGLWNSISTLDGDKENFSPPASTCREWTGNSLAQESNETIANVPPPSAGTAVVGTQVLVDPDGDGPDGLAEANPAVTGVAAGRPLNLTANVARMAGGIQAIDLSMTDLPGLLDPRGQPVSGSDALPDGLVKTYAGTVNESGTWEFVTEMASSGKIIPSDGISPVRIRLAFDTRAEDTWLKVVLPPSHKSGVVNEKIFFFGHMREENANVKAFRPDLQAAPPLLSAARALSKTFSAYVQWGGCLVEPLDPGPSGLKRGVSSIALAAPQSAGGAELQQYGSFGFRGDAFTVTFNPDRPWTNTDAVARLQYDFSSYCYDSGSGAPPCAARGLNAGAIDSKAFQIGPPALQGIALAPSHPGFSCPVLDPSLPWAGGAQGDPATYKLVNELTDVSIVPFVSESRIIPVEPGEGTSWTLTCSPAADAPLDSSLASRATGGIVDRLVKLAGMMWQIDLASSTAGGPFTVTAEVSDTSRLRSSLSANFSFSADKVEGRASNGDSSYRQAERTETLTFEDAFGPVASGSKLTKPAPFKLGSVSFYRTDSEPFSNFGDNYGTESFPTDYLGFHTFGNGVRLAFDAPVSELSFWTRGMAYSSQGVFEIHALGKVQKIFGAQSATDKLQVVVTFPSPVTEVIFKFRSGSSSFMPMDDLSVKHPAATIFPFEDLFARVEGYGSMATAAGTANIGDGATIGRADTEPVFSFSGGYSNGSFGSNESFATDYLGVFTFRSGANFKFKAPITFASFLVHGQAVSDQGIFLAVQPDGTVIREFSASSLEDTPLVILNFPAPVSEFTVVNVSGSPLMLIDNLTVVYDQAP